MAAGGHFGWPKSLLIALLAISDQYTTFILFNKMAAGGHFGWPKITFNFRSNRNFYFLFYFFFKMAAGGHFGWPKNTFCRISRHFRSIRNFFFYLFFKMAAGGHFGSPIWAILDDLKSLSIAFLAISDQYTIYFFIVFTKWPPAAILEVRLPPKTIGFFPYVLSMAMPNMKLIGEFMTELENPHEHFHTKWPPEAILFFRLMPKIIGFL